jgi:hypothetical protein
LRVSLCLVQMPHLPSGEATAAKTSMGDPVSK